MVAYREPKTADRLPIIDLGPSFQSDAGKALVAEQVRIACRDTGFFYVVNHGIDQAIIDRTFAESARFFHQPEHVKMAALKQKGTNGFEPLGTQLLDPGSPPDFKESFNMSRPALPGTPDYMDNIWPENLPGFRECLEIYQREVIGLGTHISRMIALSLGMPLDFFDATFDNQKAALRLLRYPPMPQGPVDNQLGCGAHTDWGWITVLAQDSMGGLEVETRAGDWIRVDPVPGAFVVNLGDLVPAWTNGLYHSSLHRVLNKRSDVDRYSIVLFFNHRFETPVEVVPTCLEPGETPPAPFISGEHRRQKYLESRKHLEAAS